MSWTRTWRSLVVLCLAGVGACSLVVGTDGLTGGGGLPDAGNIVDVGAPDASADATADADADAATQTRVTDGLVAFFTFEEDAGAVVHDLAPDGDHLELLVERAPAPDGDGGTLDAATSGPTVEWTTPGMSVVGRVLIASAVNASAVQSRCNASDEITVEAWVKPATLSQLGPARIVTMSYSGVVRNRNFTLGQEGDHYVFRLRNDLVADGYVERPSNGGVTLEPSHVVVTARANETMNFWVNGVRTSHALPAGGFGFQPFRVALANEIDGFTSERHWEGDYLLVAVYCRVLTEAEISRNREVGPPR